MAVVVLDLITGQQVPLAQVAGGTRPILTFEMSAGGARSLADIIARPDTLRIFDLVSRASLTYNQALAADGGGIPPIGFAFVTTNGGADFVTTNNNADRVIARLN